MLSKDTANYLYWEFRREPPWTAPVCRRAGRGRRIYPEDPAPHPSHLIVYHKTIVASGYGFLKKFWPVLVGCVLRTSWSFLIWTITDYFDITLLDFYLTLAWSSGRILHIIPFIVMAPPTPVFFIGRMVDRKFARC